MQRVRGQRYIPGAHPELVEYISKELIYLDFNETLELYDQVAELYQVGALVDDDLAFFGCNDRYFLLTGLLHRKDALHPWLFDRCREVEAEPDGCLDLWARYHYKSTIITYAGTIQDIVCDPDMTQAIISVTEAVAQKFLIQIKHTLETNELLKRIYADCLYQDPRRESPKWSAAKGIVVRRAPFNTKKEATVESFGLVEGLPAGPHFEKLLFDDAVTQKSVTNSDMIEKVNEHEQLADNLGVGEHTRKQYVGTRYKHGDTYQQIIDRGDVKVRIHTSTDNGKLKGTPVFLTSTAWEKVKRTQKKVVAAQHLMNPAAGNEASFDVLTLSSYTIRPSVLNIYILCDPSSGQTRKKSDRTAMAVIGVDATKNMYLLDGFRHRMRLSERWEKLHTLYNRWYHMPGVQNVEVGYERYGMQSDIEHFEHQMEKKGNLAFHIEEVAWPREGDESKTDRVERLEPDFRNNKFHLPRLCWHPDYTDSQRGLHAWWSINRDTLEVEFERQRGDTRAMKSMRATGQEWRCVEPIICFDEHKRVYDLTRATIEEIRFFPFGQYDDMIDCMSRIHDMDWCAPMVNENQITELPHHDDT